MIKNFETTPLWEWSYSSRVVGMNSHGDLVFRDFYKHPHEEVEISVDHQTKRAYLEDFHEYFESHEAKILYQALKETEDQIEKEHAATLLEEMKERASKIFPAVDFDRHAKASVIIDPYTGLTKVYEFG